MHELSSLKTVTVKESFTGFFFPAHPHPFLQDGQPGARETAQQLEVPGAKFDDQCLMPRIHTHMVGGEKQLPQAVL